MYACGDTVVYRHHVCEVAALRENYFEGKDYLELRALFENSLKLFVAVDEATPDNLRPIMSKRAAPSTRMPSSPTRPRPPCWSAA